MYYYIHCTIIMPLLDSPSVQNKDSLSVSIRFKKFLLLMLFASLSQLLKCSAHSSLLRVVKHRCAI
jgi:hypothetical protein